MSQRDWVLYRRSRHKMWSDDAQNQPFLIDKAGEEFYPRLWSKHPRPVTSRPFVPNKQEYEISVHDLSAEELLTASEAFLCHLSEVEP